MSNGGFNMSTATSSLDSTSLLRALDAIRNWRAYALLLLGGVVAGILGAMFFYLSVRMIYWDMATFGKIIAFIGSLLAGLVYMWGFSACGITLLDQAKGQAVRSLGDALMAGLLVVPRLIVLSLLLLAVYIAIALFVIAIFLIAKIPVVGPLVYFFAFPFATVLFGMLVFVVFFVVNTFAAPALWDGNGVMETVARLLKAARQDLLKVMVSQSLLFMLVLFASAMLAAILILGAVAAGGLSELVLGVGFNNPLGRYGLLASLFADNADYAKAAGAGMAILAGAAVMAVLLIYISGNCLLYLQYAANIDASEIEQGLRNRVDGVRARAVAAQAQVREAAARQAQAQRDARAAASARQQATARTCTQCNSPVTLDDVFCGTCGHKQPGHGG